MLTRTIPLCTILVSLSLTWFYRECCHVFEAKFDDVLEEAKFNDLDKDGISVVNIHYEIETK